MLWVRLEVLQTQLVVYEHIYCERRDKESVRPWNAGLAVCRNRLHAPRQVRIPATFQWELLVDDRRALCVAARGHRRRLPGPGVSCSSAERQPGRASVGNRDRWRWHVRTLTYHDCFMSNG